MTGFQLVLQLVEQCMYKYTGSKIWILYKLKYSFQASFWKKKLLKTAMILFFMIQAEEIELNYLQ